jgi:hypothetical protein
MFGGLIGAWNTGAATRRKPYIVQDARKQLQCAPLPACSRGSRAISPVQPAFATFIPGTALPAFTENSRSCCDN